MKVHYGTSYKQFKGLFKGKFQYTKVFTVYEGPRIRRSAYTKVRLYEGPLHHFFSRWREVTGQIWTLGLRIGS